MEPGAITPSLSDPQQKGLVRTRIKIVAVAMGIALVLSIPLMASYGLKVCPVLLPLGFRFGCAYLALFALNLLIANALFLWGISRSLAGAAGSFSSDRLNSAPQRSAWAYVIACRFTRRPSSAET